MRKGLRLAIIFSVLIVACGTYLQKVTPTLDDSLSSLVVPISNAIGTASKPSSSPTHTLTPTSTHLSATAIASQTLSPILTLRPSATRTPDPTQTPTSTPFEYGPDDFPSDINPLTGLQVDNLDLLDRRPIAVKIVNYPRNVRPQWGLAQADIVFEYAIEEDVTRMRKRLMASFHHHQE